MSQGPPTISQGSQNPQGAQGTVGDGVSSADDPGSSSNSQAQSSSSLEPPSTPQTRRKRGLSLRSQLFNKSVLSQVGSGNSDSNGNTRKGHTASTSNAGNQIPSKSNDIELNQMGSSSNALSLPPIINIDSATDELTNQRKQMSNDNNHPYSTNRNSKLGLFTDILHTTISRTSSRLSVSSAHSDNSASEFLGKSTTRRQRPPRNPFLAALFKLKNKILRIKVPEHTLNGRIIPISIRKNDLNETFQEEVYDDYYDALIDERSGEPYCNNLITSSKYTVYSFLPKQLKAQFSKIANCYFMIVAIMQMIPTWSTTGQYTTIIPLLIFMSISIAREGFDDWKRHLHDKEENNKKSIVIKEEESLQSFDTHSISTIMTETIPVPNHRQNFDPMNNTSSNNLSLSSSSLEGSNKSYTNKSLLNRYNLREYSIKWKDIKVGDIVKVQENEWIPADLILLRSENENQETFIETMALDGETNLKLKFPHPELSKTLERVPGLKNIRTFATVEDPNADLYNFEGSFILNDEKYALNSDNIIYRGSILRNTKSLLGLVVFTGEETKIRMNNIKNPRTKAPKLQKNINYIVIFMVCVVVLLSALSTMGQRIYYKENKEKAWYLWGQDVGIAPSLMGFIIMYNTLIPLSLYVTMEIIKVMQLCFLQYDLDMYHAETNTPADAKTATILEELGQVSYIFSDKTGTLTDNQMIFRKFSICGVSWLHDLDLMLEEKRQPTDHFDFSQVVPQSPTTGGFGNRISYHEPRNSFQSLARESFQTADYNPRNSTTLIARESIELQPVRSELTWKSTANPHKVQDLKNSLQLLKYVQSHPQTLFSKKAKFFLLSIALCNTCIPRKNDSSLSTSSSSLSLNDQIIEESEEDITEEASDEALDYQAASPDELALVKAARDLGFVVYDRVNNTLTIKTYPQGFGKEPKFEVYELLNVIEFSSARKRMSVLVKFPDNRICLICKGADNVILEKLKNTELAQRKAREISLNSSDRKTMEADIVLNAKVCHDIESSRRSMSSLRNSLSFSNGNDDVIKRMSSIDHNLAKDEELNSIAEKARKSLHSKQVKRYSMDSAAYIPESQQNSGQTNASQYLPPDKLLVNDEFIIEKTLEHVEEFSTEGLRTLLYSFRWIDKKYYDEWSREYSDAKISFTDRAKKIEETGSKIEQNLELIGATAIEDKLQDGVSVAIEKLRRAGIKLWMLTGDKRETAINIGYSCGLIKDYSTVVILSNDEGKDRLAQVITSAGLEIKAGRVAHCVLVIDGATLGTIEDESPLLSIFIELCIQADSTICCRASPSQKANMVSRVREVKKDSVTLAIGDGANDIAMIQSADIGVGITGKEGLQAARSADYAIAQFRFLLKLLLVNGRYNYIRTSKFVLCTFYKEFLFYLTQAVYQRYTLFSGSSLYESWSLSMFNTLFTSLPVLCVGMFDMDLRPSTLLAIPELYSKGRLYQAFNLKIFISWMILAALQSVGISFIGYKIWGSSALRDNTTLPIGTLIFATLAIVINAKCVMIEMQNRQWLAFASLIISVGGYGLWNVIIMLLYRAKNAPIFYVDYGLLIWGQDPSWWAALLVLFTIPLFFDILLKVCKFTFKPSDDLLFQLFEKDLDMRRFFEQSSFKELQQGWQYPRQPSSWRIAAIKGYKFVRNKLGIIDSPVLDNVDIAPGSAVHRKRAGTDPSRGELPPSGEGQALYQGDFQKVQDGPYEILPSGKKVKIKRRDGILSKIGNTFKVGKTKDEDEDDVDAIIEARLENLRREEEEEFDNNHRAH